MANQYHDFTAAPVAKHGFESLNEGFSSLGDVIAKHFAQQRAQEDAVKAYIQQKELDNKYALDLEKGKNKLSSDQNSADLENVKKLFPQMFGGDTQVPQQDFNPLKRLQGAVGTAVGGKGTLADNNAATIPLNANGGIPNPVSQPETGAMKDYAFNPNRLLDRKAAMFVKNPDNTLKLQKRQDQLNQKEWDKLTKEVNPLTTSGRNPLGMAMKANYNANRALSTLLNNPMVTNQEAGNVMADIASIYQNGSPTVFGMSEQAYHTLASKIAGVSQYFTGKPTDALTPDIKKRLIGVLTDMKKTNFEVIKQNLDYTEKAQAKLIKSFPDEWRDMKEVLMSKAYSGIEPHGASQGNDLRAQYNQLRESGLSVADAKNRLGL